MVEFLFFIVVPVLIMYFFIRMSKWIGEAMFGGYEEKSTFIDKSVHYHTHTHEHKHISIIDEQTKEAILELKVSDEIIDGVKKMNKTVFE